MAKAKSFRAYTRSRKAADIGGREFIAFAKVDGEFPDITSWAQLRRYLTLRGAPHEIFVAARSAWKHYREQFKA